MFGYARKWDAIPCDARQRHYSGACVTSRKTPIRAAIAFATPQAVGLMLSELIVALVAADCLNVDSAPGNGSEDMPRLEHVHVLLAFLIGQTALTQSQAEEANSSYVAKLVAKNYHSTDMPSYHEVRGRAGLVLGHLAGSLKPPVRLILWPMLLQALLDPTMRPGLPVLCRAVTQIVVTVRGAQDAAQAWVDLAQALQPGRERCVQPEALLLWLLICAHSPHEEPGLGISAIRCLEVLSPLINPTLGEIWQVPSKRLQALCSYLEDSSAAKLDPDFWCSALSQEVHFFLSALPEHDDLPLKLVDILGGLHTEICRKADSYDLLDHQRAGLFHLTGVCLSHIGQVQKVEASLDFILSHSSELITDGTVPSLSG